jgi:hypothetical protein
VLFESSKILILLQYPFCFATNQNQIKVRGINDDDLTLEFRKETDAEDRGS